MTTEPTPKPADPSRIPTGPVKRSRVMKPAKENLIFTPDLQVGMVVLLADPDVRQLLLCGPPKKEHVSWCRVVEIRPQKNPEVVWFVAEYADGTRCGRTYHISHEWLVKKRSLPHPSDDKPQADAAQDATPSTGLIDCLRGYRNGWPPQ